MSDVHSSIKAAARRTGLSPHVIRIWEKRYQAVKPVRTRTNRRLYSDAEIERLALLRQAIKAGHSIGAIAQLPNERLARLGNEEALERPAPGESASAEHFINESLTAIREMNTRNFEETLSRGVLSLGQHGLLQKVIGPLAQRLGELWREGAILAAHEHFASAIIRSFLGRNSRPFAYSNDMPVLIVTTPAGQLHELGAVMVSAAANDVGWRVIYLGTSLPASEIAAAAVQHQARAVALSIVYPQDDPHLESELVLLRRYLPAGTRLVVGGRAADAYAAALEKVKADRPADLAALYELLDSLRLIKTPEKAQSAAGVAA